LRREYSARLKSARLICERGYFFSPDMKRRYFPTPAAAQTRQGQNHPDGRRGQTLVGAARGQPWPTITVDDKRGRAATSVRNWGTPAARDWKGPGREAQLPTDVFIGRGRRRAAPNSSHGKSPGSLNPAWVEQLMGWPPGMSNCTCSATEWFLWLRQWRSWLFGAG
jgi:DNA (cytosine-5)-methyltransferase 1